MDSQPPALPGSPPQQEQQQQQQQQSQPQQHASPTQNLLQGDIAAQEAAAREWAPQLEGPLVGNKVPSQVIAEEYRKAGDIYVAKTAALPQTYSHFRKIRGDGNCGWRAIGYGYFEALIDAGDAFRVEREVARMKSFNNYLAKTGNFDMDLLSDMTEATLVLLQKLTVLVGNATEQAHHLLLATFNEEGAASSIIYHLRLLASAHLKGNPVEYEGFLDGGVQSYCQNVIEPVDREIDHIGIKLLHEVLLHPAEIALEIAYLDQSPGTNTVVYRWPESATGQDPATLGPLICLLFRPDHYDMLYRAPPQLQVPVTAEIPLEVHRAMAFSQEQSFVDHVSSMHAFATLDYDQMSMIPGFTMQAPMFGIDPAPASALGHTPMPQSPVCVTSPAELGFQSVPAPMPQSPIGAPSPVDLGFSSVPAPMSQPPANGPSPVEIGFPQVSSPDSWPGSPPPVSSPDTWSNSPPTAFAPVVAPHESVSRAMAPRLLAPQPSLLPPRSNHAMGGVPHVGMYPIRFGKEVWNLNNAPLPEPTAKNSIFKNSPYNRAHFSNPQFHPEQYVPGEDVVDRKESKRRAKIKAEKEAKNLHTEVKTEPTS
jgi:ubiquitin thioesterase protein OTUB1